MTNMASRKTSLSSSAKSPSTPRPKSSEDSPTACSSSSSSHPPPPTTTPSHTHINTVASSSLSSNRPSSQHSNTQSSPSSLTRSTKRRFSSHVVRSNELLNFAQDKAASENVAPFLNKHSPHTYNPKTEVGDSKTVMSSKPIYCNRHRPEFKCWRQANEPTMEELQSVSTFPNNYFFFAENSSIHSHSC
jgi:hypothetical protein